MNAVPKNDYFAYFSLFYLIFGMIGLLAVRGQTLENRTRFAIRFVANLVNTPAGLVWQILKHPDR